MLSNVIAEIKQNKNAEQAKNLQRFFKTSKGEYGEGDIFLGLYVPIQKKIANKYWKDISVLETTKLLTSKYHEFRLVALFVLIKKFQKADSELQEKIYKLYLKNTKYINNWDLIDLSAPKIVGAYLLDKDRAILYKLAKSKSIWEKRIAMLSTAMFIYHNQYKDTLKIAELLLNDKHDLIHKAVGWMLREVGKRDQKLEEKFLNKYYKTMPRTMLRYAIEKFPEAKRKYYLKK